MKNVITRMSDNGIHLFVAGGRLKAQGCLSETQRQYIEMHRDQFKAALPVDVVRHLEELAEGLPVDHKWLTDYFTPQDLTLISLGEYLGGNMEPYRDHIRQNIELKKYGENTGAETHGQ